MIVRCRCRCLDGPTTRLGYTMPMQFEVGIRQTTTYPQLHTHASRVLYIHTYACLGIVGSPGEASGNTEKKTWFQYHDTPDPTANKQTPQIALLTALDPIEIRRPDPSYSWAGYMVAKPWASVVWWFGGFGGKATSLGR